VNHQLLSCRNFCGADSHLFGGIFMAPGKCPLPNSSAVLASMTRWEQPEDFLEVLYRNFPFGKLSDIADFRGRRTDDQLVALYLPGLHSAGNSVAFLYSQSRINSSAFPVLVAVRVEDDRGAGELGNCFSAAPGWLQEY